MDAIPWHLLGQGRPVDTSWFSLYSQLILSNSILNRPAQETEDDSISAPASGVGRSLKTKNDAIEQLNQ